MRKLIVTTALVSAALALGACTKEEAAPDAVATDAAAAASGATDAASAAATDASAAATDAAVATDAAAAAAPDDRGPDDKK